MIWMIASIPFWASAAVMGLASTFAIGRCLFKAQSITQDDFNSAALGGLMGLIGSGTCAVIAAKLVS